MRLLVCVIVAAGCPGNMFVTYGGKPARPTAGVEACYDEASQVAHVSIPVRNGRVTWGDLLCGLARARGFDDGALGGMWPNETVRVTDSRGRIALAGIGRVFGPAIRVKLAVDEETGEDRLELTVDRRALSVSERRFKQRLKGPLCAIWPIQRQYGLTVDDDWTASPVEKNLVVLVHGLQSATERMGGIRDDVRELGHLCATFDYPNDQPIEESAQFLAEQLRDVAERDPQRKITLITHSMGGLVARAVIEDVSLDPGNVGQLIMIAPPSHGSILAHFAFGFDLWEYLRDSGDQKLVERFFSTIEDGLGEAADDLRPGSLFLEQLNGRPRHAGVRYTILLGTGGPLSETSLRSLRLSLKSAGTRSRYVRFFGAKLDGYLADLDEVVRGKGDGAVAIKRGRLEGVSDTEVLDFDHLDLSRDRETPGAKLIREAVVRRLGQ